MNNILVIFSAPHSALSKAFFDDYGNAGSPASLKVFEYMPKHFDKTHAFVFKVSGLKPKNKELLEKKYNIKLHFVSENRLYGMFQQLLTFFKIYFQDKSASYTCYGMGYSSLVSYISAKLTKNRSILRMFGTFLYEYVVTQNKCIKSDKKRCIELLLLKLGHDKIVVTDDGTGAKKVLEALNKSENSLVCYNGLECPVVTSVAEFNQFVDGEGDVFVSVSRLAKWKRIDLKIKFFSELLKEPGMSKAKLVIVGFGVDKSHYEALCNELDISSSVLFTGGLEKSSVNYILQKSKYFLSFYEAGNVGNTLLEAYQAKCIPIVRNTGLTSETVIDGVNGIVLPKNEDFMLKEISSVATKLCSDELMFQIANGASEFTARNITSWDNRIATEVKFITT